MTRNGSTRAWRRTRDRILAASTICHICGHEAADSVDHVTAVASRGSDHDDNLRPAHLRPCPTCGQRCNLRKGARAMAPIIKRSGSLAPARPVTPPAPADDQDDQVPRHVTLVAGPPCAGKTTWAREHADNDTTVLDWDDMARDAGSTKQWNHDRHHADAANDAMAAALDHLATINHGRWIVIRTAPDPAARAQLAARIRADDIVLLTADRDTLMARARQRRSARTEAEIDRWLKVNGQPRGEHPHHRPHGHGPA